MKIAVVGTRGFPNVQGGVESHCENLYTELARKGCDITVFVRKPYATCNIQKYKGVNLLPIDCPKHKYYETVIHTFKSIFKARKLKPDILHIHSIGASFFTPFAKLLGMKTVVTHHGPDYMREKWHFFAKYVLKLCENIGMRFADEVITITQPISDDVNNKFKRRCPVIPNGVIIPYISKNEECGILKTFSLEKNRYILVVGRYVPEKGFIDLIEAFNAEGFEGWKLVIVGDADHEDKYSRLIRDRARINPNIVLTGILTGQALKEIYSHARLFALPSHYEGLPIVLLEALSYGLSCIASDIPGNNIGLSRERYFMEGNIEQLRAKMKEFIHSPWSEDEIKKQIDFVHERFNWKKIADDVLNVYETLLPKSLSIVRKRKPEAKLKIVVLGTRGFPNVQGGVEVHCQNLYVQMAKKGYDIIVFTRAPYVDRTITSFNNITLRAITCPKNKYFEAFIHTIKGVWQAKKLQPDILHLHAIGPSFFAPLATALGMKVVVTHHGENYQHRKWGFISKQMLKLCEYIGMKYADRIIVLTEQQACSVWHKFGRLSEVIPNGVNLPPISNNSDGELANFGLKRNNYILSVGRFVPEKGFIDLINAFNDGDFHGIKLVIVGGADHEDKYSKKLRYRASKNPDIILTGILSGEKLDAIYRHARLFVIPSYYEGLPIVLLEAMSYGLSCIASNIPGNKILQLDEARYFQVGDLNMLKAKMEEFIEKKLKKEDKEILINIVSEKYNWETISNKTINVFENVL